MKKLVLEVIYRDDEKIETNLQIEGMEESQEISECFLAAIQRVAHEWISGGLETQHCYNLFLHAVRGAEDLQEEKVNE